MSSRLLLARRFVLPLLARSRLKTTEARRRCAVVTGSTSGIGLGIAERLAAAGFNVVLNGFGDAEQIERSRAALADQTGVDVRYDAADMTNPQQIQQMIADADAAFGGVDVLVNNAGVQHVCPIEEFPDDM